MLTLPNARFESAQNAKLTVTLTLPEINMMLNREYDTRTLVKENVLMITFKMHAVPFMYEFKYK